MAGDRVARAASLLSPSLAFATAGAIAVALYLTLPTGGLAQAIVYVLVPAATVAALVHGVRRHLRGWVWQLLLGVEVVYLAATAAWYLLPVGFGVVVPYPSVLDPVYWLAYSGWAVVLFVIRQRETDHGPSTLDMLGAAIAISIVGWIVLLEPVVANDSYTGSVRVASTIYPLLLTLLSVLAVHVMLTRSRITIVDALLVVWIISELAGDVWYSLAAAQGTFYYGHPGSVAWMVSTIALGALALRPDAAQLTHRSDGKQPSTKVHAVLSALYLGVAVVAPALHDPHTGAEATALAVAGVTMVALLVSRIAVAARDLRIEQDLRLELETLAREMEYAATHDALTGLPNRRLFNARLEPALTRRRRAGRHAIVMLVDVNAFKSVNDTYGHPVGDALLAAVAARLAGIAREADIVARLGGDEFALVFDDADMRTALLVAERVLATVSEPVRVLGKDLAVTVSIGLHVVNGDGEATEAMVNADVAMYAAKQAGGGIEVFDGVRHQHVLDRFRLEQDLRAAAVEGGLEVYYQPIVELATRRVVDVEALVRWAHPTRGFLEPLSFIDVAEESGAIVELGRSVLRRACTDCAAWQATPGGAGVGVAINLSRRQLYSASITADVERALADCATPARLVTLEVTETALMADTDQMVDVLRSIKRLGVQLAMDDFGTGYSSLAHLRALPVDVLKIDKAFVHDIAKEDEQWTLAAAILRLAVSLGKRTLAEGIEHPSQLAHLRSLGCELGQGWLFARAMPLADLLDYLGAQPERTTSVVDTARP